MTIRNMQILKKSICYGISTVALGVGTVLNVKNFPTTIAQKNEMYEMENEIIAEYKLTDEYQNYYNELKSTLDSSLELGLIFESEYETQLEARTTNTTFLLEKIESGNETSLKNDVKKLKALKKQYNKDMAPTAIGFGVASAGTMGFIILGGAQLMGLTEEKHKHNREIKHYDTMRKSYKKHMTPEIAKKINEIDGKQF